MIKFDYEYHETQEEVRKHIQECQGKHVHQVAKKVCIECGIIFSKPYSLSKNGWAKQKLCSRKCRSKFLMRTLLKGENNPRWNGGRGATSNGYIEVISPPECSKNTRGRILEHRKIMEEHLKRKLLPTEVVHHINHNKQDNRMENLELIVSNSEHIKRHRLSEESRKKISLALKDRLFSKEHRIKLSLGMMGNWRGIRLQSI